MRYAGFGRRFAAGWIDWFVLLLPGIFLLWLQSVSRPLALAVLFPHTFLFYAYEIYFHGRGGQTIGKRDQKIRVVSTDNTPITWKQAFLRSSVGLGLASLSALSTLIALLKISDEEFARLSWTGIVERQNQLGPYLMEINLAMIVWVWSEVVVLLFNRKRRALHDFMAGTVVIDERYQTVDTTHAPDTDPR